MKLTDWAKKQKLSYMTCYRWFKEGKLPPEIKKAYQTKSGTIIVETEDDSTNSSDPLTQLLNIAFKYTQEEKTIFEFASYVASKFNFTFKDSETTAQPSNILPESESNNKITYFQDEKSRNELKRKKELIKCALDQNMVISYSILESYGDSTVEEIHLRLGDLYSKKQIDSFIDNLRKHFDNDSKINSTFIKKEEDNKDIGFDEIEEEYSKLKSEGVYEM